MLSIKPFETVYLVEAVALDDSTAIKRGFIPLRKMQDCLSITTHVGASLDAPLHRYSICTDTIYVGLHCRAYESHRDRR
jgi:hypothetical protein